MVEIAVIGAGAAGIVTARHLMKLGIPQVVVHLFERRTVMGGAWQCNNKYNNNNNDNANNANNHQYLHDSSTHSDENDPTNYYDDRVVQPPPPPPPLSSSLLHPQMWDTLTPNLSKYTCCFSDQSWSSVVSSTTTTTSSSSSSTSTTTNHNSNHNLNNIVPMFPSLQQMNHYLNDYCITHNIIPSSSSTTTPLDQDENNSNNNNDATTTSTNCIIQYGCTVTRVTRCCDGDNNNNNTNECSSIPRIPSPKYEVQWETAPITTMTKSSSSSPSSTHSKLFDGVVIATGFFSQPKWPRAAMDIDPWLLLRPPLPLPEHEPMNNDDDDPIEDPIDDSKIITPQQQQQQRSNIIHSSQYQSSSSIFDNTATTTQMNHPKTTTIAIIGNSFSAHEIASELAFASMLVQPPPLQPPPPLQYPSISKEPIQHDNCRQRRGKILHFIGSSSSSSSNTTATTVPYVLPRNLVVQSPLPPPPAVEVAAASFAGGVEDDQPNDTTTSIEQQQRQQQQQCTMVVAPIDTVLYRRRNDRNIPSSQQRHQMMNVMDTESCHQRHTALQQYIGQRKLQQAAKKGYHMMEVPSSHETDKYSSTSSSLSSSFPTIPPSPPHVSISDHYLDLVIDDQIQIVLGQMVRVIPRPTTAVTTATDDNNNGNTTSSSTTKYDIQLNNGTIVPDIDQIICCTGYQCSMHDFVDNATILQSLQYDPNDTLTPLVACYDAFHPSLPNFGMVGMYKGPYFGIMELQAKIVAHWLVQNLATNHSHDHPPKNPILSDRIIHDALLASETRRHHHPPRPQFPHFDYIGMMDEMTQLLRDIEHNNKATTTTPAAKTTTNTTTSEEEEEKEEDASNRPTTRNNLKKGMMVSPLFNLPSERLINQRIQEFNDELQIHSDRNMAKSVLSALIGSWSFHRVIADTITQTTQIITGTIRYSLLHDGSVRYREDGIMKLPNGIELDVFREYDYLSDSDGNGNLEIMFVENGIRTYRFLSLKFNNTIASPGSFTTTMTTAAATSPQMNRGSNNDIMNWLTATSDHLCVKDLYTGTFQIQLDGCSASAIRITYNVQGPTKDYVSVTNLQPIL